LFLLLVPYVQWRSRVYRLTDRRLILEEGIVTRRSKSIPLARLQDVTSIVGPLGRLFNYGSLQVENAGESPGFDLLRDVPDPARFRELLLAHAAEARSDGP
jgi:membrane protein YdbS with pleckstrin-like domain